MPQVNKGFGLAGILVISLSVAALYGCNAKPQHSAETAEVHAPAAPSRNASDQSPVSTRATRVQLPDFSTLVDAYGDTVVNVTVVQRAVDVAARGMEPDDRFGEFFRRFGVPRSGPPEPRVPSRGMGSGFIVSADGYILTNAHVVDDASEVTVKLTDRREFPAKVIGVDTRSDVAVLKIDAKGLPVARLGDAHQLKPGQWVIAIGAPFGFENSVTAGVVSSTARALPEGSIPFIQTDVAVNPGNSGGPLFNLDGEVVGINSQIYSRTGGYEGISFAIPINVARDVEQQLVKSGRVVRGRIGVAVQDVNADLAESFGLSRPGGALVSSVEPGGPADKAGVQPGDVVLQIDGEAIEHPYQLSERIAALKPGTLANLGLWRNRGALDVKVRVTELKEAPQRMAAGGSGVEGPPRLGLSVRPLTPQEREAAQARGTLVVVEVTGRAAAAGVQPGDILIAVNGKRVSTVSELRQAADQSGKVVALLIQREDAQVFVPIPAESQAP